MKLKRVFGENILAEILLSPKVIGSEIKILIPETYRKRTNFVRVLDAGPDSGVATGEVLMIKPDVGHELELNGSKAILLLPDDILGRIEDVR